MGVRGLTTYIAKNADKYLEPFELHDCNLVIDGDSVSSNLYRWTSQCNSAFGGDYDQYYRTVLHFFQTLKQCNITAYVLLDGGYERKKLHTVRSRLRAKIGAIKHINPFDCFQLFPLQMREVFVAAVKACGVPLMRCLFEADDEVAILARKLDCPVLSYDSDFYIYDVQYVPMITLTIKVHKKKVPRKQSKRDSFVPYNFLDCSVYRIENLAKGKIHDNMLPLFGCLLGNDYIGRSLFRKFYANVSLKGCGKRNTQQERRIIGLLRWLRNENLESAIRKVLSRVEKEKRQFVSRQIEAAMSGYVREKCEAFEYFHFSDANYADDSAKKSKNSVQCLESILSAEFDVDDSDGATSTDETDSDDEDSESDADCEEGDEKIDNEQKLSSSSSEDTHSCERRKLFESYTQTYKPADWLRSKIMNAEVPRFIVDLLCLKIYVNSPQIENFLFPDSNTVALPILQYIFTLLGHEDGTTFQYLTRVLRITDVHCKVLPCLATDRTFDPLAEDNPSLFEYIFNDFKDSREIFSKISTLPSAICLYFLAIIYWSNRSKHVNLIHIHSLLVAYCVLNKADAEIVPVIRDSNAFLKKYGSVINSPAEKPNANESFVPLKFEDKPLDAIENGLTKNECIQLEHNVLPMFQINDKIRQKHTEFSSTIIHGFAEFQAIVFNMNCLNAILNYPYAPIEIAKCFNGTLLYNLYMNLKDRPSIAHYAQYHLFRRCPVFYQFYEKLLGSCAPFVSAMNDPNKLSKKRSRNRKKNLRRKRAAQATATRQGDDDDSTTEKGDDEEQRTSDSEFDDCNNHFSKLLKI